MRPLVFLLLGLLVMGAAALPPWVANRMRQYDVDVAEEVVAAVVVGFLLEESATEAPSPWFPLLTSEPPADHSVIAQATLIRAFDGYARRDVHRHECHAYGEALAQTLTLMGLWQPLPNATIPAFTVPPPYDSLRRRMDVVATATARCFDLTGAGHRLSPRQYEALSRARFLGVTSMTRAVRDSLPPLTETETNV